MLLLVNLLDDKSFEFYKSDEHLHEMCDYYHLKCSSPCKYLLNYKYSVPKDLTLVKYAFCMHINPNCIGYRLFIYEIATISVLNLFSDRVSHSSVAGQ